MKFTESDYIKLKLIEKIVTHGMNEVVYSEWDEGKKTGYMKGIFDSLYTIVTFSVEEDNKKILNE